MLPTPDRDSTAEQSRAEDLALVRQAVGGNEVAREQLVQRLACVPAMMRDLHRRYNARLSREDLADVQQSSLTALWAKLNEFEGRASLETWAFRFIQNELLKALERRDRHRRSVAESENVLATVVEPTPDEVWIESKTLLACLDQLGDPGATIIRSRHFEDQSFEDIARARQEPINTIKARYYRGLEYLRDVLEPHRRKLQ